MKRSWRQSMACALEGIITAWRSEHNLRIHICCTVIVLIGAGVLKVKRLEWALLIFAIGLVLVAELINTALEAVVDLSCPTYHPLAKVAKDVAAGAVLLAAINAVIIGVIVFGPYLVK